MRRPADSAGVAAISAMYQAERADASSIQNAALGLMAVSAAYLVGTIALLDEFSTLEGWVAVLPFPLVCASAYHSLLVAEAVAKVRSILILESHLRRSAGSALGSTADEVGAQSSERIMNLHAAGRWEHKASTIISYGGVGAVVLGYTTLLLVRSADFISAWVMLPAAAYVALFVAVGRSWLNVLAASSAVRDMAHPN